MAPAPFARPEPPEPTPAIWISFAAMIFGNFMALLDVQIVASALTDIQAGVGASNDEISWVQTSYLIAEVIAIPLSGFLGRALGVRLLFCIGAVGFAIMSACCAMAWDMQSLIVFRTLQGFVGGALIPTTMAVSMLAFPTRHQALSSTMIGLVSTLAPSIGPTLGGFVADGLSWRWLFWINVIPGFVIAFVVWTNLKISKPNWAMLRAIDLWGLVGLAAMLGGAQFVLEEGPKLGWSDPEIIFFGIVAAAGAVIFFKRSIGREHPIVDLRPFTNPHFAISTGLAVILGAAIFAPIFLQPLFLAQVRGFSPLQIGHMMFAQGMTMFFMAPVAARLTQKITDPRPVAACAFLIVATSCWMQAQLTADSGFWDFVAPQVLRGVGMMAAFMSVMRPAFATLPAHLVQSAAGLFNLLRNLGGAFGIAILLTIQQHALALHRQELYTAANPAKPQTQAILEGSAQRLIEQGWRGDPHTAALGQYIHYLDREALVMTFNDQFLTLAVALLFGSAAVWFLGKPPRAPMQIDPNAH